MSISRTLPAEPKSTVTVARAPVPEASMTVPNPYFAWLTRSPTTKLRWLFFGMEVAFGALRARCEGEDAAPCEYPPRDFDPQPDQSDPYVRPYW